MLVANDEFYESIDNSQQDEYDIVLKASKGDKIALEYIIKKYKNFNQISPVALHLFQESAILNRIVKWRDDMSQAVVIKSNKYGIHLVLSNEISFKALLDAIVEKFKESEKFRGKKADA